MSNRTLRRPMFRIGGSAEGITSGLDTPKRGLVDGPGGYAGETNTAQNVMNQMQILDQVAPQSNNNFNNFLISMGLDLVSRPKSGNIFSQVASSAKGPFQQFQQAEAGQGTERRALAASFLKGLSEGDKNRIEQEIQMRINELGEDRATASRKVLDKKHNMYGVLPRPGEAKEKRLADIEDQIAKDQDTPAGMIRSVAEHIFKIETGAYPKEVQADLNKTKTYIKPNHIAGTKKNAEGEVIELIVDSQYDRTYKEGEIYFDAQTGGLFKRIGKSGEEIIFTKVIY